MGVLAIVPLLVAAGSASLPEHAAEVFEQVCVDGSARFAASDLAPVDPATVHYRARSAMMPTLWLEAYSLNGHSMVEPEEMPSIVYRVNAEDEILLLLPDEDPANPVQASCTVLIKGDKFAALANFAAALTLSELPDLRKVNTKVAFRLGDHGIAVGKNWTRGETWTVIASAPLS